LSIKNSTMLSFSIFNFILHKTNIYLNNYNNLKYGKSFKVSDKIIIILFGK